MPEVLADRRCPSPTPSRDGTARRMSPCGEEPPLVEQAVRRQEQLPMDVADLAVLEQGRGDEQPVVGRLLDERDDRPKGPARRRGEVGQPRVVEADRDLGGEVLELVAGQPELGEDDEVGALRARLVDQLMVTCEVRVELARAPARSARGRRAPSACGRAYAKPDARLRADVTTTTARPSVRGRLGHDQRDGRVRRSIAVDQP